jgi:hypothetical protein
MKATVTYRQLLLIYLSALSAVAQVKSVKCFVVPQQGAAPAGQKCDVVFKKPVPPGVGLIVKRSDGVRLWWSLHPGDKTFSFPEIPNVKVKASLGPKPTTARTASWSPDADNKP